MRIGIDAHNLEGERTGVGRYLLNILRHWPHIAPPDTEVFLYFKKEIPKLPELSASIFHPRLLKPLWGRQSMAAFTHILLPKAAKNDKVDVLWCPAYVAPLWYRGKLALTLHDIIFAARPDLYDWPSFADRLLLGFTARHAARRSSIIFAPSQFTKKEITRLWRIPDDKIAVTPLAPDTLFREFGELGDFDARAKIEALKTQYGLSGKRYFFFYGTLFKRRKIREIIDAFKIVAQEFHDLELIVAGSRTSYSEGFMAEFAVTHLAPSPHAMRWKAYIPSEHIPALIRGAQAVLYLSEYEGFGLPILEAMAAGAPVITSRTSSIPEVAGECAIYVANPNDVEEIAGAMRRVLLDTGFQHDKCQCGFLRAKQFSWERCAEQTLNALYAATGLRNA